MRRSVWGIVAGLVLALLGAAAVAKSTGLPLAEYVTGEKPIWHLLRTALPIAAFALPGALIAILISEVWRVRGPLYWLSVGVILALLAHITLTSGDTSSVATFKTTPAFNTLLGMGVVGGLVYWLIGGRSAGALSAAIAHERHATDLDERSLRKRCRMCSVMWLALGLLPLGLIGWHMTNKPSLISPAQIVDQTAAEGTKRLAEDGLPWAKLTIEDHVGRISGTVANATARTESFEKSKIILDPMVGLPGVVAYLQNDIKIAEAAKPAEPVTKPLADSVKLKSADEAKLAAEAKKKADEAASTAKEAAAKRKADEAAAKAKAEEEARVAAEAKRKADEAAAKAKAEEEARVAAEDKRKADEAAAKAKASESSKVAAAAPAPAPTSAPAAAPASAAAPAAAPASPEPDPKCVADFADAYRSTSIRFAFDGSRLDADADKAVERYAAVAARCGGFNLTIGGHADRNGSPAVNMAVSQSRANAVRQAFVARGVAAERLKAIGYGSERPFDNSRNKLAYSRNRRVEIAVSPTQAAKPATPVSPPTIPATPAPVAVVPQLPVDQCNAEFSRAFASEAIRFVGASAIVADGYADILDRIANLALSCPTHTIAVSGHTDRRGSAAYNSKLSVERAEAVRDALIDRDVPAARLQASGYGGERPFDPANTPAAYALNRRVDFGAAVAVPKSR